MESLASLSGDSLPKSESTSNESQKVLVSAGNFPGSGLIIRFVLVAQKVMIFSRRHF